MKTFDLNLPKWGPYNKAYLGAAHIADSQRGYRFDHPVLERIEIRPSA